MDRCGSSVPTLPFSEGDNTPGQEQARHGGTFDSFY